MNIEQVNEMISEALTSSKLVSETSARIDTIQTPYITGVGVQFKSQPFIVHNGQVYINSSMIESGTIKIK